MHRWEGGQNSQWSLRPECTDGLFVLPRHNTGNRSGGTVQNMKEHVIVTGILSLHLLGIILRKQFESYVNAFI